VNTSQNFPEASRAALHDERLQGALKNLKQGFQVKRAHALEELPEFEAMREAARAIRANALSRLDTLLVQFETRVSEQGGHVHWARDAGEARSIISGILKKKNARNVTKGKSMVSEEIELNAHLVREGFDPIETDLGEYIIQLRGEGPSHIIAPAFHLRRQDVEESFREAHTHLDPARAFPERASLVAEARAVLRQRFESADAGITGANFLIAETGSAMVVTNEGNGDLTRLLPKTHIIVTGIEKVIPSLNDAALLLALLTRSATGQHISSYVTIATGPKRKEDTDGPEDFHVVLVDNGRSALLGTPAHEALACIRCGACLNHCPVYGAVGGHAYGAVYPGPIGAALDPGLEGLRTAHHLPQASSFCGRCETVCPVKIPLTRIMRHWRTLSFEQGIGHRGFMLGLRLWGFTALHPRLYRRAAGFAGRVLRMRSVNGRISRLPILRAWFAFRDLPAPAQRTFQSQWKGNQQ